MEFSDKVSALIFALILIGVLIYVAMSRFVIGPLAALKPGERIIIVISIAGLLLVVVYAALELLFHVVF